MAKITKETVKQAKKEIKEKVVADTQPTKEEIKLLEKALEEAKMPVKLTDKEFQLGEQELDIRSLNAENKEQMMFRMQILNIVYQRQLTQSIVDLMRIVMVIGKKLGIDDIIKETDILLEELKKKVS